MKINKSANRVFEAIVDPVKIGNYWFSYSSERWEQGKSVTLRYDEYQAEGEISILKIKINNEIVFSWGGELGEETIVTITFKVLESNCTLIEIIESGFNEKDPELIGKMVGQKEGWVYMLSCLKSYLENGVTNLRASLVH
ncbi:SRPBCC domain-containing protein [Mesobacillus maritimus]|uniref:SRPBCC domain-containing protein n=2 Tax=Mesobacillus maritimus TaxID=1643336 RepID=A0ABS7K1S6_9BACI|nr:SRPBCC domain-containing protein [Mesobacillus maritimus]